VAQSLGLASALQPCKESWVANGLACWMRLLSCPRSQEVKQASAVYSQMNCVMLYVCSRRLVPRKCQVAVVLVYKGAHILNCTSAEELRFCILRCRLRAAEVMPHNSRRSSFRRQWLALTCTAYIIQKSSPTTVNGATNYKTFCSALDSLGFWAATSWRQNLLSCSTVDDGHGGREGSKVKGGPMSGRTAAACRQ